MLVEGQVMTKLRQRRPHARADLTRWIGQREIVWFSYAGRFHLPLFQFHRGDMMVRPIVSDVLQSLRPFMDDGQIADWFVTPNSFIAERRPIDCLDSLPEVVSRAARLECTVGAERIHLHRSFSGMKGPSN